MVGGDPFSPLDPHSVFERMKEQLPNLDVRDLAMAAGVASQICSRLRSLNWRLRGGQGRTPGQWPQKKAKAKAKTAETNAKAVQSNTKDKARAKTGETAKQRAYRVSLRGLAVLKAAWSKGENPLPQRLHPDPWPPPCHSPSTLTESEFLSRPT